MEISAGGCDKGTAARRLADTLKSFGIEPHIVDVIRGPSVTRYELELDRGVTLLEGRGGYSGKAKNVILCAFSRAQIVAIKSIVKQADPDAFIIVCDAYEILGEGFGVNTPNGL